MQDLKNYRIDDVQRESIIAALYNMLGGCKNYSLKSDQHLKAIAKMSVDVIEREVNKCVVDAVLGKLTPSPELERPTLTPRQVLRAGSIKGVISTGHNTVTKGRRG